jgi:hypothetical protein
MTESDGKGLDGEKATSRACVSRFPPSRVEAWPDASDAQEPQAPAHPQARDWARQTLYRPSALAARTWTRLFMAL